MATDNPTATIPSPESDPEISLGDFETLPNELHPAAFVFKETVDDLVQFYGELPVLWAQILYEYTQKAQKEVQS